MERNVVYDKKQLQMEELQAFALYLQEGMKAVERMFPQHKSFVENNKTKAYREVKRLLFAEEYIK